MQMCKVLSENEQNSIDAYMSDDSAGLKLRENLLELETLGRELNQILLPVEDDRKQEILRSCSLSVAGAELGKENFDTTESFLQKEKGISPSDRLTMLSCSVDGAGPVSSSNGAVDTDMEEKEDEGTGEPGFVVLED